MDRQGDEIHISEQEASAGRKTGRVRWILGVGLALAIGLLALVWMSGIGSEVVLVDVNDGPSHTKDSPIAPDAFPPED